MEIGMNQEREIIEAIIEQLELKYKEDPTQLATINGPHNCEIVFCSSMGDPRLIFSDTYVQFYTSSEFRDFRPPNYSYHSFFFLFSKTRKRLNKLFNEIRDENLKRKKEQHKLKSAKELVRLFPHISVRSQLEDYNEQN
jgi:hypothetical protein